ncbi:ATP-dependent Clp protease ATP-binding subunit [Candidatus Saccharibacteria bacterium]|nr:ATP-dependent Clp protease ATP-binding subunit [Candidatus Saccharibacteria bacterium]
MESVVNYSSERAQKARLAHLLGEGLVKLLAILAVTAMVGGFVLVATGSSYGWLIVGMSVLPAMVVEWYNSELKNLPIHAKNESVDAVLDSKILGMLPKNPSPKQIAETICQTNDGLFYGVRAGITPNLLRDIASDEQSAAAAIWQDASAVQRAVGSERMTAGMLVYAIVKQFPEHNALLAHLHLSLDDIEHAIRWQQHIHELYSQFAKVRRTGGIARDWSFGYVPLLNRFGVNISDHVAHGGGLAVDVASHSDALEKLIETFSSGGRQNIALVGPAGVGKTTVVEAFAEELMDASSSVSANLKFRQVFMLDASSLISAAPGRGELEDLVTSILGEAYAAKNVILCLDDAQLFFEDGVGSVNLTNVLLPVLEAGRLRMILTMDEQRFLEISRRNPSLANALNRSMVAPASKTETIAVMQDKLLEYEFSRKVTYTYQSLHEAYRLSERYVHDLEMPGRALKLLEAAAGYSENGLVTMNSVQAAIEKTMNIKVGVASGEQEREKLLNLEDLIHQRMINQTHAVEVVSDALRRARAGVRNESRPIGTFLFLGPTGVGKTELAKALAEVYFNGESNLIRLDLNEFVRSDDVTKLIADATNDATSLTAQIMKQPFSVVLLDEIEKAHPSVLTTLLQLLDEGILRDEKNREISFRDAIIIATSNAGADRIREYIDRGYKLAEFEEQFTNELISSNIFKPEFINRFDEVVIFKPLGKKELLQVIDLMIAGVNKTLEVQKVRVEVSEDARELLVEKGYDPRLGARPMRRVVQKAVENTVAKKMLSGEVAPGSSLAISRVDIEQIFNKESQVLATRE